MEIKNYEVIGKSLEKILKDNIKYVNDNIKIYEIYEDEALKVSELKAEKKAYERLLKVYELDGEENGK